MTNCRGCGAEVIWVKTITGRKKMPLDAEPVRVKVESGGKADFRKDGYVVIGRIVGDAYDDPEGEVVEAHESHFATCPVGGQFRNRKPRTRAPGYR